MTSKQTSSRKGNPYPGWKLYFPDKEYDKDSEIIRKLQITEDFFKSNKLLLPSEDILKLDIKTIYNNEKFMNEWKDFKTDLRNDPEVTLNCLGLAAHQVTYKHSSGETDSKNIDVPRIKIKIRNYDYKISLSNMNVALYNKLVSVRGCVMRVSRSKQLITTLVFRCIKCDSRVKIDQKNGIYVLFKKKCESCGGQKYEPDPSFYGVKAVPFQLIRLQERYNEEHLDNQARVPRVLDVELIEDFIDSCIPGDDVTVTGILKMKGTDNGKVGKSNSASNCPFYLEAIDIVNCNSKLKNSGIANVEFHQKDYILIKAIHNNPDTLGLLVRSLAPGILGHEMIKFALLLSLFGGSSKRSNLRNNIHTLIVGDPGLGKSQLLQACARVASKGVYISGNSSTSSGLTVTLIKEGSNDFALEPGALVLADRGTCCIDEFDKMPTQHQALLESMEQQSVSVAKAGIVWSLPSRTSVLAAANPNGGRFDSSKTLAKNLNISLPLLSRFDIVFLLLDQSDEKFDDLMAEHVMMLHAGVDQQNYIKNEFILNNTLNNEGLNSFKKRLQKSSRSNDGVVEPSLLRKYIAYAREYVKPILSENSGNILKKFYLNLRKMDREVADDVPVCLRQFEALIRLTEARAKLDLREETTEQDALEVIELFGTTIVNRKGSHLQNAEPLNDNACGKSSKNSVKTLMKLLQRELKINNKKLVFTDNELKILCTSGHIDSADISKTIDKLNEQGILIRQGKDSYKYVPL